MTRRITALRMHRLGWLSQSIAANRHHAAACKAGQRLVAGWQHELELLQEQKQQNKTNENRTETQS